VAGWLGSVAVSSSSGVCFLGLGGFGELGLCLGWSGRGASAGVDPAFAVVEADEQVVVAQATAAASDVGASHQRVGAAEVAAQEPRERDALRGGRDLLLLVAAAEADVVLFDLAAELAERGEVVASASWPSASTNSRTTKTPAPRSSSSSCALLQWCANIVVSGHVTFLALWW
jgi:hypothetical protein